MITRDLKGVIVICLSVYVDRGKKQPTMNQQKQRQKEKQLQELTVAKAELTGGDTSGLVYVRSSPGAAFLIKPRVEALKDVQQKIDELKQSR